MPYVPGLKTMAREWLKYDGNTNPTEAELATAVEALKGEVLLLGREAVVTKYETIFPRDKIADDREILDVLAQATAKGIAEVAAKYKYKGAHAGELNYTLTRILNHLPRELMKTGEMKSELRYYFNAIIYGVLLDVALEHKTRVNKAYEIAQIKKSGDCYDGPYYNRVMDVMTKDGKTIGSIMVNMARSDETLNIDVLPNKLVAE
jgi:hypothetical protein